MEKPSGLRLTRANAVFRNNRIKHNLRRKLMYPRGARSSLQIGIGLRFYPRQKHFSQRVQNKCGRGGREIIGRPKTKNSDSPSPSASSQGFNFRRSHLCPGCGERISGPEGDRPAHDRLAWEIDYFDNCAQIEYDRQLPKNSGAALRQDCGIGDLLGTY